MNLYLDQSERLLGKNVDGRLLNAARLGLVFDGDTANSIILRLSEASNPSDMQSNNTVVNGTKLNGSQVLRYRNGSVSAVRVRVFRSQTMRWMLPWGCHSTHCFRCRSGKSILWTFIFIWRAVIRTALIR